MKLTKSKLKEMIKEELLKEQPMNIRSSFYELGDKIENLKWINRKNTELNNDKTISKIAKQIEKLHDQLYKYLNKTFPGWD